MKLHFDSSLDYQNKAIDSVVKLFKGQRVKQANFSVLYPEFIGREQIKTGFGNKLDLDQQQILKNLQQIQLENKLPQSEQLNSMNFTIEMETGTGKTYVYLKTIYELNQVYGFTKFVIVVPSVAIREGVNKTLEITKEHFADLFDGVPVEAFVYDSSNLEQVRNFAASNHIQIMIINIDAFRKSFDDPAKENKANIIHRDTDKLEGQKPIDLIRETNPIVIIDEPQSVDTTKKSKEAIASLNPLCTLRYSATHVDKHHMIYRLDAIDAYEQKLVKQIEVLSVRSEDSFNLPYIKLIETKERQAIIELDIEKQGMIKREQKNVKLHDSLYDTSGNRELYQHYQVEDISWESGNQYVIIRGQRIDKDQAIGDIDEDLIKRFQIRQTIEEHLKKEMTLNPKGIKVLSLFFIDRVAHYRDYDLDGNVLKGKYAKMFEEEYEKLIKEERFKKNQNYQFDLDMIHNGYFSQDKKGILKDTKGNTQADEDVYNLIMKDKERLLDMKTPLRFIFSHSALREGWDNPNVFQICTLKDTAGTYVKRRQEIGRGLRLAVNQKGERVYDENVNVLTVMANETYADFAKNLQTELEEDTGKKFGVVLKDSFALVHYYDSETDREKYLGATKSEQLVKELTKQKYLDKKGNIQPELKEALMNDTFDVSVDFKDWKFAIIEELERCCQVYRVKDATKKERVQLNKAILDSEEFIELWNKINQKTMYTLDFDSQALIKRCVEVIQGMPDIHAPKMIAQKDQLTFNRDYGVGSENTTEDTYQMYTTHALPDILTELQNKTNLTRRTIADILIKSQRLVDFERNPQTFIEKVAKYIKDEMRVFLADGVKYEKVDDCYHIETFESEDETLLAYLNDRIIESKKSPYNYAVCDSKIEMDFAKRFEADPKVKVYVKLPNWFKIETPLGNYNPDWAAVIEKSGKEQLYFVIETKGEENKALLRPEEQAKINCATKHFKAIDTGVIYEAPVAYADDFLRRNTLNNL